MPALKRLGHKYTSIEKQNRCTCWLNVILMFSKELKRETESESERERENDRNKRKREAIQANCNSFQLILWGVSLEKKQKYLLFCIGCCFHSPKHRINTRKSMFIVDGNLVFVDRRQ